MCEFTPSTHRRFPPPLLLFSLTLSFLLMYLWIFAENRHRWSGKWKTLSISFVSTVVVAVSPGAGDAVDAVDAAVLLSFGFEKMFCSTWRQIFRINNWWSLKMLGKCLENAKTKYLLTDVDHVLCFVMIEICMDSSMFALPCLCLSKSQERRRKVCRLRIYYCRQD